MSCARAKGVLFEQVGGRGGERRPRPSELVLKLATHITTMLVLVNGPKEQRLSAALFFPPFPDVLLLLLLLDKMFSFVPLNEPVLAVGIAVGQFGHRLQQPVRRARRGPHRLFPLMPVQRRHLVSFLVVGAC